MIRIILADDHAVMRRGLRLVLEQQEDFEVVGEASDGRNKGPRIGPVLARENEHTA